MRKEVRRFKVYEQSGHNYKPTPIISADSGEDKEAD